MPLKQNFDSESFEGKNAISLPRTNKIFSMLVGSNEVVHHDRLASDEMHHDGTVVKGQSLLNISGAKVRETEFRYYGKYLSRRKIDCVLWNNRPLQVRSANYALSVTIIKETFLSGFFRFEKPYWNWGIDTSCSFLTRENPCSECRGWCIWPAASLFFFRRITSFNNW